LRKPPFAAIADAIEDLKKGRLVILTDDENRENEGDLVGAAELISPEQINFMLTGARGTMCLTLEREWCQRLNLHPQTADNTTRFGTAFTVTIDAADRFGVTTGVSVADRHATIKAAIADSAQPSDFVRPGHVNPIMARDGGVLVRAGQTEGSVDLCRLAGLKPAGVIIEIMNNDGTMARGEKLVAFALEHGLKIVSVAELIEYRLLRDKLVHRIEDVELPTEFGHFRLIGYTSIVDSELHLALCCGGVGDLGADGLPVIHDDAVLVRVHSECLTGDVFRSQRCECGEQLDKAMQIIQAAGKGVIVYLRQEGRGIGLRNKLKAYRLQDQGHDTVEANALLGFPADKRDYGIGAQILRDLGLRKLRILTNNPKKVSRLEVYGVEVVEQLAIEIPPNAANLRYLQTKKSKLGHLLSDV
jgi:3,4-dihydroxy 2-butanone 4-phosphate synthase/GTP cyclohydrolase II